MAIAKAYKVKEFLKNPQVTVSVSAFVKLTVSVLGQVGSPGAIEIPGGQQQIDLLAAIAKAGDFKGIANKKKVRITRKANQRTETHDVKSLMTDDGDGKAVYLYPGDVVFVPQRLF
jgi:protein involved in polysaccharide export with SLBB domain